MSYEVLARKWRPETFDAVVGQQHVTRALRNAIRLERVPHAILLTGPRGVGKTTVARLVARCLNCDKGPTETPCGQCDACREIAAGRSIDVQELDAASRTGVDDVREWIESVHYAPTPGKHHIFVVDEVHMLSTAAFNALLKTLEEPPPRTLFVFATTNPERIPFTVISRCQRHDLRRLSTAETTARLREIAGAEGVRISEKSLFAIAREGEGSLRDALTLLDQVIAAGGGEVDDERVAEILDLIDRRLLLGILEACVDGDPARALEACGRAASAGIDAKRLGGALLQLLRDLVVLGVAPDQPGLVEASDAELPELRALADRSEPARLRRMFRALLREQEDLAWAPEPFAVLEMAVVRLATLPSADDVGSLLARLDALERRLDGSLPPPSAPEGEPKGRRARNPTDQPARSRGRARSDDIPDDDVPDDDAPPKSPLTAAFDQLREFIAREDPGLAAALEGGRLLEQSGERIRLALPGGFAAQRLARRARDFEELCSRFYARPVRVDLARPEGGASGPAPPAGESDLARHRRQEALAHPAVNTALEILEGEVIEIRPLGVDR